MPAEVFKRLRFALLVTVLFNLGFGFSVGGIDNAAHLGGLTGGFLAGLLLVPSMDGDRLRYTRAAYPLVALGSAAIVGLAALAG